MIGGCERSQHTVDEALIFLDQRALQAALGGVPEKIPGGAANMAAMRKHAKHRPEP